MKRKLVESMSMEEAFRALNDIPANVQILNEALYKDTSGIMGEVDAMYSSEDLQKAWEEGKHSDPSMLEYQGDFNTWLEDTLANMTLVIDDEADDSLDESTADGQYCIVGVTKDGDRKFYKDGEFIDDCKDCTVFTDLDEARDIWSQIDKSEFKRVFVPNWSEDMFCEDIDEDQETSAAVKSGISGVISDTTEILNEASAVMMSGLVEYFDLYKQYLADSDAKYVVDSLDAFIGYIKLKFIDEIEKFKNQLAVEST